MPAGFTHLSCSRKSLDYIQNLGASDVRDTLEENIGFLLLGSVAPDLPYLGALGGQFKSTKSLADSLHYKRTNEVPLMGLKEARTQFAAGNIDLGKALFAFYLGYSSHLIADGIIHPFVRDMVGDYEVASKEHRILEMRLDVLVTEKIFGIGVNGASLQEDLDYINESPHKDAVLSHFSKTIFEVHGHELDLEDIEQFINGFRNAMNLAEGKTFGWYQSLLGPQGAVYVDLDRVRMMKDELTILTFPVDAESKGNIQNFLKTNKVDFFEDVLPRYFDVFPNVATSAHEYLNGKEIDLKNLIREINLDTGRPVNVADLNVLPVFWET